MAALEQHRAAQDTREERPVEGDGDAGRVARVDEGEREQHHQTQGERAEHAHAQAPLALEIDVLERRVSEQPEHPPHAGASLARPARGGKAVPKAG